MEDCPLKPDDEVFNLALFKIMGFYQMFDPSGRKIFNFNVYQLIFIGLIFVEESILIYGFLAHYFSGMEDTNDLGDEMFLTFAYMMNILSLIQTLSFMYKSNEIWELFNVARNNFLTSKHCHKQYGIRTKYGKFTTQITNYYCVALVTITTLYIILPIVLNVISFVNMNEDNTTNRRLASLFYYRFPVTVDTYNKYFLLFYIIDVADVLYVSITHGAFYIFTVLFGLVFIAQYEVITRAFANIGYDEQITQNDYETYFVPYSCDDYKQVLIDQQKLYLKLKSFYSIIWFGLHSSIALLSFEIIILSFTVVLTIFSNETTSAAMLLKLMDPFFLYNFELLSFCYIMEAINTKKELSSYGMYSSNWTGMCLKTKKNLLLLMRMDNANKLMMKITPYKIINLQLFTSILKISYNIVSVMVKARN